MERLESQQLDLMEAGRERNVLILVDDITLDHVEKEKLAHLCVRGRHFHVSVMMLSVSYSNFHKSCRRSSDFICLFSMGCQSDRELMMKEFAHKQHQCEFFMNQIVKRDHTAAILNLNEKSQNVYWYRAPPPVTGVPCRRDLGRTGHENRTAENEDGGGANVTFVHPSEPGRIESPTAEPDPVLSVESQTGGDGTG